ncbi:MAG: metallophosphoesterase [Peptoniphilaceae bacterium]|nr:metallophosphoesterase [Peptoniphilaceae bacterium]MDD7383439.1 metallophosphoesterase [Peptoniphilaceae bacterium]MDY3738497.1 metallophosphoesterase [Peptoniphilaceae bacterium]
MKLLILSDTHGYIDDVIEYIEKNDIEYLAHAGDYADDAELIKKITKLKKIYTVRGNGDRFDLKHKDDLIFSINEHKIFLTHGHKYSVNNTESILLNKSKEFNCDIVIFGHTHRYLEKEIEGIKFLNPGSVSLPRDKEKSMMLIEIDKNIKISKIVI